MAQAAPPITEQVQPTTGPSAISLGIDGFRGVREGRIENLSPLSILVGPNNSGKSTCLEAAALALTVDAHFATRLLLRRGGPVLNALGRAPSQDRNSFRASFQIGERIWGTDVHVGAARTVDLVNQSRQEGLVEPMEHLNFQWSLTFQGSSANESIEQYIDSTGKMAAPFRRYGGMQTAPPPMSFLDVDAQGAHGTLEDAYSSLEETGRLDAAIRALRTSFASLEDLRILKVGDEFVLHTLSKEMPPVPAYLAGDGFKRFIVVAAGVLRAAGGVVLLEEPECYQHPRYLREMARLLVDAAAAGTTVILSTHSLELIQLLAHGSGERAFPTVHRLRLVDGRLTSTVVDHARVVAAIDDIAEDLRA